MCYAIKKCQHIVDALIESRLYTVSNFPRVYLFEVRGSTPCNHVTTAFPNEFLGNFLDEKYE